MLRAVTLQVGDSKFGIRQGREVPTQTQTHDARIIIIVFHETNRKIPNRLSCWSSSVKGGWARRGFDSCFLFFISPFPPSCSADKTDYGISILAVSHSGRNFEEEKDYLKSPPRVVVR